MPVLLRTLLGLVRHRVWGRAPYAQSPGTATLPTTRLLISGQHGRPSLLRRSFAVRAAWGAAGLIGVLLALCGLAALLRALTRHLPAALLELLDGRLAPRPVTPPRARGLCTEGGQPLAALHAWRLAHGAAAAACALHPLSREPGVPAPLTAEAWSVTALAPARGWAGLASLSATAPQAAAYRPYLGEWRRLLEQAPAAPAAAAAAGDLGSPRLIACLPVPPADPYLLGRPELRAPRPNERLIPTPYGVYLAAPWVF